MSKPMIDKDRCVQCGVCITECAAGCIDWGVDGKPIIDEDACIECLTCSEACPAGAIKWNTPA